MAETFRLREADFTKLNPKRTIRITVRPAGIFQSSLLKSDAILPSFHIFAKKACSITGA